MSKSYFQIFDQNLALKRQTFDELSRFYNLLSHSCKVVMKKYVIMSTFSGKLIEKLVKKR